MSDTTPVAPVTDTATPPPATTQTPATPQAPAFDGPEWLAQFPDDIKTDKSLYKYTSAESAARGLINAQRLIGVDKIPKPKGDFDPANPDWQMYLDAAGRPKSADEYKFEEAKLPEGLAYDTALEGVFRTAAHSAGLNGKQAQMMRDAFVGYQAQQYQAMLTEISNDADQRREAMKRELGSAYEPLAKAAEVAQKEFISEALLAKIDAAGLAKDPEWTRVLGKIGQQLVGETKLKTAGGTPAMSPADYRAKADEYRSKHADALFNNAHPDHKRHAAELQRLMEAAFVE